MSERRAFLDAICDDPDSDTPRLVYADWLEEHGEGRRAEFIRCQCELARRAKDDPRRAELRRLACELFDGSWAPAGRGPRRWRRGFLWRWVCTDAELLAALDADAGPMFETTLELPAESTRPDDWASRVAAHPRLDSVVRVRSLGMGRLWPDEFAALIASPHLRNLNCLEVNGSEVGPDGVRALCDPPAGFRLTRLALVGDFALTGGFRPRVLVEEAVRLIATDPAFAGLKSLVLVGHPLSDVALADLLESPTLGRSLRLELRDARWSVAAETAAEFRRRFDPRSRFD